MEQTITFEYEGEGWRARRAVKASKDFSTDYIIERYSAYGAAGERDMIARMAIPRPVLVQIVTEMLPTLFEVSEVKELGQIAVNSTIVHASALGIAVDPSLIPWMEAAVHAAVSDLVDRGHIKLADS